MTPSVEAPRIDFHVSHPPPSWLNKRKQMESTVSRCVVPLLKPTWTLERQMRVQFPETRLIQYDCGMF